MLRVAMPAMPPPAPDPDPAPAPAPAPDPDPAPAALDVLGTAVSCACAAHCLALPAVVTLLPSLGLGRLLSPAVEWAFLAATLALGVGSLGPALWRARAAGPAGRAGGRGQEAARAALLFLAGFALLAATRAGLLGDEGTARERWLVLGGAALVVGAHLVSWRRARRPGRRAAA